MRKINKKLLSMLLVICMVFGTPIFIDHGKFSAYAEDNLSNTEALEWAKDPGMGIRKLHEQGYTGKGVNIAYIGQPFGDTDHDELRHIKVHYYQDIAVKNGCELNTADIPGRAIISNLAGKNIGIAPNAEYYYVANPTARKDQNTDAEALRQIIAINKKLPKDKKFKIVGLGTYWQELNPKKKRLHKP